MNKPKLAVTTRFLPAVEERIAKEYQALRPAIYSTLGREDLLALAMEADAMQVAQKAPCSVLGFTECAFQSAYSAQARTMRHAEGVRPLDALGSPCAGV